MQLRRLALPGLLKGKTIAVDATTLEANAAMKSIVRRDTGEDWNEYVKRLMQEAGVIEEGDEPTVEEIARFDRKRKDKKVSNQEWQSETDTDSRIAKMKDGRTHLDYEAEHAIDLDTGVILAAPVYHRDESDPNTIGPTVNKAQDNLIAAESEAGIKEVVADNGFYKNETLVDDVAIVDPMFVLAVQMRQTLGAALGVPDFKVFGEDADRTGSVRLRDIGISKSESSRAQRIARLSETNFK